jgi:predicted RNA methylase
VIDARSEAADALLDYNSAANQPHREQFRARAARTRDVMITADDFAFETTFVPAGTGTGRLYTSTLTGPHGSAFASCDTAAQAVTHAAAAYETRFLDAGMVPEAR